MSASTTATPGSRLSDDLYSLYLAGLGWLLLPFYGDGLAEVLPSDFDSIEPGVDIAVVVLALAAIWSGFRGGPLMVSRAGVLHELASGASRRQMLYPRFLRQLVARAAIAAIAGTVFLALSTPGEFEVSSSLTISVVALLAASISVSQSMVWHIVVSADGDQAPQGRAPWFVAASLVAPLALVAVLATNRTFFTSTGLVVLLLAALFSLVIAIVGLEWAPVERLWSRARALETMRSSMQTVDFQQMLLDMRKVTDKPRVAGRPLARSWMPTPVWRQVTALQHGLAGQLARLAFAAGAIAALLIYSDPTHGIVALAIAGCIAIIGFDLAVPIAATADHLPFLVHYRHGSARVLQGQTFTAVAIGMSIGAVLTSSLWADSSQTAVGALLLFLVGTLAALMQARIGSPDVAKWASTFGPSSLGPLLWARALSGPLMLLAATVAISHQYFRPDEFATTWGNLTMVVAFSLAVVTMQPLEKSLR